MQTTFNLGQNVIVERTSGAAENGWTVTVPSIMVDGVERTQVRRNFHGETIIKCPRTEELAVWQVKHIDTASDDIEPEMPSDLRDQLDALIDRLTAC